MSFFKDLMDDVRDFQDAIYGRGDSKVAQGVRGVQDTLYGPRTDRQSGPMTSPAPNGQGPRRPARQGGSQPEKVYSNTAGLYDARAADTIIQGYVDAGYDPRFAAAMAANAMVESGGNPTAFNKEEGAFGAFQHRMDRLDNMREYVNRLGMDINDLSSQVSFSIHEFGAAERMAYERIMGGGAESAADYARLIDKYWERSDGRARDKRAELASVIYEDFFADGRGGKSAFESENGNILSFGEDIDPMGSRDNQAFGDFFGGMASPEGLSMGEVGAPTNPIMEFALGQPTGEEASNPPQAPTGGDYPIGETGPAPETDPMGYNVSPDSVPAGETTSGPAPVPTDAGGDEASKPGGFERFLDKIYGTKDLSDEERRIRRRAMAEGFAQSLGYLTNRPVDMSGVFNRKSEAYKALDEKQKEQVELQRQKMQADALAKMATDMGLGSIAGLAYQGKSGIQSLSQALAKAAGQTDEGAYDVAPAARERLMGMLPEDHPARSIIEDPNAKGKPLEDAVGEALKYDPTSGDSDGPLASSAGFADFMQKNNADPSLIDAMKNASTAEEQKAILSQAGLEDPNAELLKNKDYQLFRGVYGQEGLDALLAGDPEMQKKFEDLSFRSKQASSGVNAPKTPGQERAIERIAAVDDMVDKEVQKTKAIAKNMELVRQAALDPDFQSGIIEGALFLPMTNIAQSLGVNLDLLDEDGGPLRLVQATSKQMATLARTEGAGATSNFDAQNYMLTAPREMDTRENILMLSQMHKYQAQQAQEVQKLRNEYLNTHSGDADYYNINKMDAYVEENLTRKDIFPEVSMTPGMGKAEIESRVNEMAKNGQIEEGDIFIVITPDGRRIYSGYGIPNFKGGVGTNG